MKSILLSCLCAPRILSTSSRVRVAVEQIVLPGNLAQNGAAFGCSDRNNNGDIVLSRGDIPSAWNRKMFIMLGRFQSAKLQTFHPLPVVVYQRLHINGVSSDGAVGGLLPIG